MSRKLRIDYNIHVASEDVPMRYTFLLVPLFVAVVLTSCVTTPVKMGERVDTRKTERQRIVDYAESLLGRKDIASINGWFRNDCSGYVLGVYRTLGYQVRFPSNPHTDKISLLLFHELNRDFLTYTSTLPNKADVVFFRGTIDSSLNKVSHVGIVADSLKDGTIRILNYTSRGVTELRMNLKTPSIHKDEYGTVKNDFIRKKSSSGNEKLLSGEFFYCFGNLLEHCSL